MKLIDLECPGCGASLHVESGQKNITCSHCGKTVMIDDEVHHVQYDNAEEAGYKFEKGRQRAQEEARINQEYERQRAIDEARRLQEMARQQAQEETRIRIEQERLRALEAAR